MVIHSTFPEFVLFLYVHVANVDNTYDPKEISTIKDKMARLFPGDGDLEKKLYQAIREYNRFDRANINDLIKRSLEHFSKDKEANKTRLFEDVNAIINADGQVQQAESDMLHRLNSLLSGG